MPRFTNPLLALALLIANSANAIETLAYTVLAEGEAIEIRAYEPHLLASVSVGSNFENAGSQGFRPLFNYIAGNNADDMKISMTSPVIQEPDSARWQVSFVMPGQFDLESLPEPRSDQVKLGQRPSTIMAAISYRGGWSRDLFLEHERRLFAALENMPYVACGPSKWARHDPPIMPWFMRRNEILVQVCRAGSDGALASLAATKEG